MKSIYDLTLIQQYIFSSYLRGKKINTIGNELGLTSDEVWKDICEICNILH